MKDFSECSRDYNHLKSYHYKDENQLVKEVLDQIILQKIDQDIIHKETLQTISELRNNDQKSPFIDILLQEYGLSSDEGITLMRLSEALIRTPDTGNAHALLRDKLCGGDWHSHARESPSFLVNRSTDGLRLCSTWIKTSGGKTANHLLAKMGDAAIYSAMKQVMRFMGNHFVLGRTIGEARKKRNNYDLKTTCFSYDMLGEAALTLEDADTYFKAYEKAVDRTAKDGPFEILSEAPSISVKLSAIYPRYENIQSQQSVPAIYEKLLTLCLIAKQSNFGIAIDAEECERLEISLTIIENLCACKELENWGGLSIVVQAYQKRALPVIDHIISLSQHYNRKLMVRLVKGAYWDSEIKRAQELGLESYPVFTRKENTDINYIACAQKLLDVYHIIFPQFATHNAQTANAIAYMAKTRGANYEFQRLHGMGEQLHTILSHKYGVKSRIYAPVGAHKNLLPYLVRRLLENGANSSFVNQLSNEEYTVDTLSKDPISITISNQDHSSDLISPPREYLNDGRLSAPGFDWTQSHKITSLNDQLAQPIYVKATSIINGQDVAGTSSKRVSPFDTNMILGEALYAETSVVDDAIKAAQKSHWSIGFSAMDRAALLMKISDNILKNQDILMSLLVWEAGKTVPDAIAEIREAVDFCRYYANQTKTKLYRQALGIVVCISPWNFPLAIFLGQIVAALAMGNIVIAKPAEQTPLIAYTVSQIILESAIPIDAFHLLIGDGEKLGNALTRHKEINGICFTGSTKTAKHIATNLSQTENATIPFIAETGGINTMIVDSTALLEQVIFDVIASGFQSAGQRCSACRLVCVQEDIADEFITMLHGAMAVLQIGKTNQLHTDIGPVIDRVAHDKIKHHIATMKSCFNNIGGKAILGDVKDGFFIEPHAFEIKKISDMKEEIFGPVLHVMRFKVDNFDMLINDINASGYGLTMGLHTRIDQRAEQISKTAKVGNLYVNRNQIGAVVGVQPFGGEGLSGTGPKAGGPFYLNRLSKTQTPLVTHDKQKDMELLPEKDIGFFKTLDVNANNIKLINTLKIYFEHDNPEVSKIYDDILEKIYPFFIHERIMPSPTGESNILSLHPRGKVLCMGGDDIHLLHRQIAMALASNNDIYILNRTHSKPFNNNIISKKINVINLAKIYENFEYFAAVACDGNQRSEVAKKLTQLEGPIMPLLSAYDDPERYAVERCVTIDTTAAGGNAYLLAAT